jgi:hypothetical protein
VTTAKVPFTSTPHPLKGALAPSEKVRFMGLKLLPNSLKKEVIVTADEVPFTFRGFNTTVITAKAKVPFRGFRGRGFRGRKFRSSAVVETGRAPSVQDTCGVAVFGLIIVFIESLNF